MLRGFSQRAGLLFRRRCRAHLAQQAAGNYRDAHRQEFKGEHTKVFKIDKQIVAIEPGELVDLQTLKLKQDYPAKEELARLLRAKEYDKIDWDEKDED